MNPMRLERPAAISMWDFSWLERRWAGAGYESWEEALDGLVERGYDAVRIDAYPHLVAAGADRAWELVPVWNIQEWGSPGPIEVKPWPALAGFLAACRERGVRVGLSSWFREDRGDVRRDLATPGALARAWLRTLELVEAEGLMDAVLYVDLCNEFPGDCWAPFYSPEPGKSSWDADSDRCFAWMTAAVKVFRAARPAVPVTFSFSGAPFGRAAEVGVFDLLDPHLWMASQGDYYARVGHKNERYDLKTWDAIAAHAEAVYRADERHWRGLLEAKIAEWADFSRRADRPLITTEGWAIIDYRDWPGLDWGWVKELCGVAVEAASAAGRWSAICTSNFCGPQFRGMWRDVEWHRGLTRRIRSGGLPAQSTVRT